ncbi:MAG TPA: reverse transcriptase family protein [Rhizomicrobium sp.]|jgi:hypothetical protein
MKRYDFTLSRISVLLASGAWTERAMRRRLHKHVGRIAQASQRNLVRNLIAEFDGRLRPSPLELTRWLRNSAHFALMAKSVARRNLRLPLVLTPPAFSPLPSFEGLDVPHIRTSGDLAKWLGISMGHLDWFADSKRQHASVTETRLQHYKFFLMQKSSGRPRLIEAPKASTKHIQKKILHEILDHVPVDDRAHGFVKGRSCLSSASAHASEVCVLAMDMRNFFHSIEEWRINRLFRSIGYPDRIAGLLTRLCMTTTPAAVFSENPEARAFDWMERKLLSQPHLPQGAPTSPALANLIALRLDRRLAGLAARYDANYTRYADDWRSPETQYSPRGFIHSEARLKPLRVTKASRCIPRKPGSCIRTNVRV